MAGANVSRVCVIYPHLSINIFLACVVVKYVVVFELVCTVLGFLRILGVY